MARVTVEDCLDKINNRFQLVLLATKRARVLSRHPDEAKVPWNNDKPTVVALREIADRLIHPSYMQEKVRTERFPIGQPMPVPSKDDLDLDEDL